MKNKIMAFDLGTTGIKVVIFDDKANALATEYREYPSYYPHNDWVNRTPTTGGTLFATSPRPSLKSTASTRTKLRVWPLRGKCPPRSRSTKTAICC